MARVPTMVDVARRAGVGLKTVSRYVNGEQNIAPDLAARIAAAIADLGYRRNIAAASIRPGWTSKVLGLVVADLANPFFFALAALIEAAARDRGYLVIAASSDDDDATEEVIVERLIGQRVDGLLLVPARVSGLDWGELRPPVPPAVVLDRPLGDAALDTILADNYGGAFQATTALLASEPRRIGFLSDQLTMFTMRERHRGFMDAVAVPGRTGGHVPDVHVSLGARTITQAVDGALELLQQHAVDAILAANNRSAMGALRAFQQVGRRVPLIGVDDFEAAPLLTPPVSVVSQDVDRMATIAVERLVARIDGADLPVETITVPTTLTLRGSERI